MSSFSCPHCGASDSSIQPGAAVEDRGVRYTFRVQEREVCVYMCSYKQQLTKCGMVCVSSGQLTYDYLSVCKILKG